MAEIVISVLTIGKLLIMKAPKTARDYDGRECECQEALELPLADVLAEAQAAGWTESESFDAVEILIRDFRETSTDESRARPTAPF